MITKEKIESAIKGIDECVDSILEHYGKYHYSCGELVKEWGNTRRTLARKAADILASGGKKPENKQQFRGYPEYESKMAVERPTTVIEISKAHPSKSKLFIHLKKAV